MGQMKPLPEFFQGSIAQDFPGILHVDDAPDVCKGKKSPKIPPNTSRPQCTNRMPCTQKSPSSPPNTKRPPCTRVRDLCHKKKKAADAFVPGAEGWSIPPAPPVF